MAIKEVDLVILLKKLFDLMNKKMIFNLDPILEDIKLVKTIKEVIS